jgi:hypothetical protein
MSDPEGEGIFFLPSSILLGGMTKDLPSGGCPGVSILLCGFFAKDGGSGGGGDVDTCSAGGHGNRTADGLGG